MQVPTHKNKLFFKNDLFTKVSWKPSFDNFQYLYFPFIININWYVRGPVGLRTVVIYIKDVIYKIKFQKKTNVHQLNPFNKNTEFTILLHFVSSISISNRTIYRSSHVDWDSQANTVSDTNKYGDTHSA